MHIYFFELNLERKVAIMRRKLKFLAIVILLISTAVATTDISVSASTNTKYTSAKIKKTKATKYHLWVHGPAIKKYKIVKLTTGKKHHKQIRYKYKSVGKRINRTWGKKTLTSYKRIVLKTKKGKVAKLYYFGGINGYVLAKDLKVGGYVVPPKKPVAKPVDDSGPIDAGWIEPMFVNDEVTTATSIAMNTIQNSSIKTPKLLTAQMTKMNTEGFLFDEGELEKLDVKFLGLNLMQLEKLARNEELVQNFIKEGGKIKITAPSDINEFNNVNDLAETYYPFNKDDKIITIMLSPDAYKSDNLYANVYDLAYSSENYQWYTWENGLSLYTTYNVNVLMANLPISTITHEFGHVLQDIYIKKTHDTNTYVVVKSMQDKYIKATGKTAEDYIAGISAYSHTNGAEGFAEAYCSYRLDDPTPQNIYVPEEVNNWVKIVYGN